MGNPKMEKPGNARYRKYRTNLPRREEARGRGQMFMAKGYERRRNVNDDRNV